MKCRVLIFGGTGFIGTHLSHYLESKGYEIATASRTPTLHSSSTRRHFTGDMTTQGFIESCIEMFDPQFIFNLASAVKPGRDPKDFEQQMGETILPAFRLAYVVPKSVQLTVFCGSCEEYGNAPTPFREDGPTAILSPYGWGKVATKSAVEWICRERGVPSTWIRPFLTFGPGQKPQLLIPHLIKGFVEGRSMDLTAGDQTRDFVYVRDVCAMMATLLDSPDKAKSETYNLCSGVPRRIRDVAVSIHKKVGAGKLNLGAVPYRSNEVMSFFGCPEKFDKTFSPHQHLNFDLALDLTIDWYQERLVQKFEPSSLSSLQI
jgi:UDP-glucose 4-epimerase